MICTFSTSLFYVERDRNKSAFGADLLVYSHRPIRARALVSITFHVKQTRTKASGLAFINTFKH